MNRVATLPLQQSVGASMQRAQARLADIQAQLASGRKAQDFAALGRDGGRLLSAHSLTAREEAYGAVAKQLSSTLTIYDASLNNISDSSESLRQSILAAVGTGQTLGLQATIESAFSQFRQNINVTERGVPIFGGGKLDELPFSADKLSDLVGTAETDVFVNDDTRLTATVGQNTKLEYGVLADEVGSNLYQAFKVLAEAGEIGENPTPAQAAALEEAMTYLDKGTKDTRLANAANGRRQQQIETIEKRSTDRVNYLSDIISKHEDADLAQIAIDLAQQQTALQASYSVYGQLKSLSLLNYLR
jgi:flagellar hook-associated protein 3 FlgL